MDRYALLAYLPFITPSLMISFSDNYSIALSWITQQTGVDPDDIRKYLEIDGEPDYEDLVIS
jgi:hypothetical protein